MKIIEQNLIKNSHHAYLIGIGGSGMSGLARILKHLGLRVSGSDTKETRMTESLREAGIEIHIGQKESHLGTADLVIYSSAIHREHVELKEAKQSGLKVHHRAEILASLLNHASTSIAVTGTHGKTTTSAMLSYVLSEIGANPTCVVGSEMLNFNNNVVAGGPDYWVCEVDESDSSHEFYAPHYSIITNLEPEHLDHYSSWENLEQSFRRFLNHVHNPGLVAYLGDDPALGSLVKASGRPHVSFGFSSACDYSAQNIHLKPFSSEFDLYEEGFFATTLHLSVPGRHNIANALATLSILLHLGFDFEAIQKALNNFRGTKRRMEVKWQSPQLLVLDDYAHHPTEVKAVLKALHEVGKYVRVIFQPHRYSRVQHLCHEFAHAFDDANEVILTDIYSAGENNPNGIGVTAIYDKVVGAGHSQVSILKKEQIIPYLLEHPLKNGVMVFMGAGDIGDIANEFVHQFGVCASA